MHPISTTHLWEDDEDGTGLSPVPTSPKPNPSSMDDEPEIPIEEDLSLNDRIATDTKFGYDSLVFYPY